jgi:GT2 family glycosyltransferase
MLFSVIVPTHNRPALLKKLLISLNEQNFSSSEFEVIIIPSPKDNGASSLQEKDYFFSLRILSSEDDTYQGKSASFKRNKGAQHAQAPWLAFIDDDCVADKNWLKHAAERLQRTPCDGIEGLTVIPKPEKITHTYKGLQRLSSSGGYQTCNMFYRKEPFLQLKGFDLHFPFYLEDTDLAWTFLDAGFSLVFEESCVVFHPVPPADVDRLWHNAVRTRLLPYLYKKHPRLFQKKQWRALQRFHWLFLILHSLFFIYLLLNFSIANILFFLTAVIGLSAAYTTRQLWGCSYTFNEAYKMLFYFCITPWVTLVQLLRGNWQQKVWLMK